MREISILKYSEIPINFWSQKPNVLFHSKAWIEVLQKSYYIEFLLATDAHSEDFMIFGIIDNPFNKKLVSIPFSDYAGEESLSVSTTLEIIKEVQQKFPNYDIEFKSRFSADLLENSKLLKKAFYHRIDLENLNYQRILETQSSSFKRGVKKALKQNVVINKGYTEVDLKEFYKLYTHLRLEKFKIIPQPFSFFQNIFNLFFKEGKGFILKASYENILIGSILILEYNEGWYYKFGASHKDYLDKRPNNYLFNQLIQLGIKEKKKFIDLGMSGAGNTYEGLIRFKEEMGGKKYNISVLKYAHLENGNFKRKDTKVLSDITSLIVAQKPSAKKISSMSEFLYPFFA